MGVAYVRLCQSQNVFVTDKDPRGQNISVLFVLCYVNAQLQTSDRPLQFSAEA